MLADVPKNSKKVPNNFFSLCKVKVSTKVKNEIRIYEFILQVWQSCPLKKQLHWHCGVVLFTNTHVAPFWQFKLHKANFKKNNHSC